MFYMSTRHLNHIAKFKNTKTKANKINICLLLQPTRQLK